VRELMLLVIATALIGAGTPTAPARTSEAQAKLDKHLGGRVAGQPEDCLRSDRTNSPIGIDDHTILFRDGPRIWRNDLRGGYECGNLSGRKALVTQGFGRRVCSGETVSVVNLYDGSLAGACVLGPFVPYAKPN
jgi:hypothetical protein